MDRFHAVGYRHSAGTTIHESTSLLTSSRCGIRSFLSRSLSLSLSVFSFCAADAPEAASAHVFVPFFLPPWRMLLCCVLTTVRYFTSFQRHTRTQGVCFISFAFFEANPVPKHTHHTTRGIITTRGSREPFKPVFVLLRHLPSSLVKKGLRVSLPVLVCFLPSSFDSFRAALGFLVRASSSGIPFFCVYDNVVFSVAVVLLSY